LNITLPNGAWITNTYDNNGRMLGTWLTNSSGSNFDSSVYTSNVGGSMWVNDGLGKLAFPKVVATGRVPDNAATGAAPHSAQASISRRRRRFF
jgi:hypothetical protein